MHTKWQKLGRIFAPSGEYSWMQTHAVVPVALGLGGERYRAFFGTRDAANRTRIAYVEFNIDDPANILKLSPRCILDIDAWGHFGDSGVYPGSIIHHDGKVLLYYSARNNGEPPLFYMSIGLAVSEDTGLTFRKLTNAPIMSRNEHDPWMVSTPFVLKEAALWRMWYLSGLGWNEDKGDPHSYYHIKYAESDDGIDWCRDNITCIELRANETNVSAPSVLKENGLYKMWYSSVVDRQYRIGYAESFDGKNWTRKDEETGIDLSASGWDSESMAYPHVFIHNDKKYMLYSGNGFGRDGFGLAVEESEG